MKHKVVIFNHEDVVIYEGKLLDLPIKMESIREKSMELFKDPDPCIIHQSYAIQKLITPFVSELKKNEKVLFENMIYDAGFIDLPNIESCSILLKG